LHTDLERIQETPPTEHVDVGASIDPRLLVGLTRSQIIAWLGATTECSLPDLRPGERACESYDFFRLPSGWVGGGTVLEIFYDGYGQVARARWIVTI